MQGPKEIDFYVGRYADCQRAITPLVIEELHSCASGVADAETVLVHILPKAQAIGWEKEDVTMALLLIAKATGRTLPRTERAD